MKFIKENSPWKSFGSHCRKLKIRSAKRFRKKNIKTIHKLSIQQESACRAFDAAANECDTFLMYQSVYKFAVAAGNFGSDLYAEINSTSVEAKPNWSKVEERLFHHEFALFFSRLFQAANFTIKGIVNLHRMKEDKEV